MNIKFITILFILLISSFIGEVKAEEICYYSNSKEHRKCKKVALKAIPKYPIENFHTDAGAMGPNYSSVNQGIPGATYKVIEFKAPNKEVLKVYSGTKSVGLFGLTWRRPWINQTNFEINPRQIVYLKKRDIFWPAWPRSYMDREINFKYIDDNGEVNSIKFQQFLVSTKEKQVNDLIGDYLLYASNLKWGEEIPAESKIEKILKENEKFLTITKSIILKQNSSSNNCFIAKDSKFPELTQRYKKLYKTITPLRAKINLPPASDLKPICS